MASNLTRNFLFNSRVVQTSFVRTLASQGSKGSGTKTQSGGYGGSGPSSQQASGRGGNSSSSQRSDGRGDNKSPSQQPGSAGPTSTPEQKTNVLGADGAD